MRPAPLLIAILLVPALCHAKTANFQAKLHRHKSGQDRLLVDKLGVLTFDDANRQLTFRDDASDRLEIRYESITKALFEVSTHMRGGTAKSWLAGAVPVAGMVTGPAVWGQHVHNYWFYLEYKNGEQEHNILLEVPRDSSQKIIEKTKAVLGSRVAMADYPEKGEQLDPSKLPDRKSKQVLNIDKRDHPIPETKPGKATIVVVCPPLSGYNGRSYQFKLHANGHVIAVNKWGTYSFAYVDPGKYRLVSQSENAYSLEMELEAGKAYYFLQNSFQGLFKSETSLTRNSPELVMYLLDGSYYSQWRPK